MNLYQFLNKRVRILILDCGTQLQYHGQIADLDESHVYFIDKFGKPLLFAIEFIQKIELEESQ